MAKKKSPTSAAEIGTVAFIVIVAIGATWLLAKILCWILRAARWTQEVQMSQTAQAAADHQDKVTAWWIAIIVAIIVAVIVNWKLWLRDFLEG